MIFSSLLSVEAVLDVFSIAAFWAILSILLGLIVAGIFVRIFAKKAFPTYLKYAGIGFFALLLLCAVAFFALDLSKTYGEDEPSQSVKSYVLIPLLCLAICALLSLTAFALTDKFCPKAKKWVLLAGGILCGAAILATIVCLIVYYNQNIAGDGYYNSDSASVEQIALYISALLAIASLVGICFIDRKKLTFDAKSLALAGVCAGMSYALSYIKIPFLDLPNGGSVTLVSMLPIMVYAYLFGIKKGIFIGLIYGTLQAVQDPWIIHPAQFVLDYPVAFAMCGLAGLFNSLPIAKKAPQLTFALGATVGGTMRIVCHILSGALAFQVYAGGQNPWIYSILYNSLLFIDVALVLFAGIVLFSSKSFLRAATNASGRKKEEQAGA